MLSFFRAVEPVCRVICTAAYYDEYRRKYFPELFDVAKTALSWDQFVQTIADIDPYLAAGLTAGATIAAGGVAYYVKNRNGQVHVEVAAPTDKTVDPEADALRKQQEAADKAEALRKQQEEADKAEALRKQEEAVRQEALRKQEAADKAEALRKQEEAVRQEALRKQEAADKAEALRKQQEAADKAEALRKQEEALRKQAMAKQVDVVALSQPQGAVAQRSQAELLAEQSQRLLAAQEALAKQAPRALPVAAPSAEKADEPTTVKERMARARQVAQSETALKLQQMPVKTPAAVVAVAPKEVGQKLAVTPLVIAFLASTKATPIQRQRYKLPQEKSKVVNEVLAALHSNGSVPTSAQEIADFNRGIDELETALDAKLDQTQGETERAALISHKSTVHSYRM